MTSGLYQGGRSAGQAQHCVPAGEAPPYKTNVRHMSYPKTGLILAPFPSPPLSGRRFYSGYAFT